MSNADELLTDIRDAARAYQQADPVKTADRLDAADRLAGLFGQLDDHMSVSATPPADWPQPLPVGRCGLAAQFTPAELEDLIITAADLWMQMGIREPRLSYDRQRLAERAQMLRTRIDLRED